MIPAFRWIALIHFYLHAYSISLAQAYCRFDAEVNAVYTEIVNLNFEKAEDLLCYKSDSCNNLAYLLLENELDFYSLFIREEKEEFRQKKSRKNERLQVLDNSDLPLQWKRFLQAEIHLQWALLYLIQQEELGAFQSIRRAIKLLEQNVAEFPDYIYSYKSLGILHTLMSTIPEGFQWAAWLLGIGGQLYNGKSELEKFIQFAEPQQDLFLVESYAAMSYIISFVENKPHEAYNYWVRKMGNRKSGCLETLIHCKLAMKAGRNDAAFSVLEILKDDEKQKLPLLFLLQGITAMQKLDLNADTYLHKFLKYHRGNSYIKETYQKLSWIALLKGQTALYHLYISNCLVRGITFYDEDKHAKTEAQSGIMPDPVLLTARLLFDGGYYHRAYEILINRKSEYVANPTRKLEYVYRMGRICQMKGDLKTALEYYREVLSMDIRHRSHMSVNALLQSGIIYEAFQENDSSRKYFKRVLQAQPDQYKNSLHQKAKAGLERLKR